MTMRKLAILTILATAFSVHASDANAQGRYWPWCARYNGWTIVCSFDSFRQCMETVSGVGGICQLNIEGPPVSQVSAQRKRKHRHRY
jgi:hypothetical protein